MLEVIEELEQKQNFNKTPPNASIKSGNKKKKSKITWLIRKIKSSFTKHCCLVRSRISKEMCYTEKD